jgi:hypothetical protein
LILGFPLLSVPYFDKDPVTVDTKDVRQRDQYLFQSLGSLFRIHCFRRGILLYVYPVFIEINGHIIFRDIPVVDPKARYGLPIHPF